MPASVVGSQLSWAVYLFAAAGLILVVSPGMTGILSASRQSADLRVLDGLSVVVDSLKPGLVLNFTVPASLHGRIVLQGNNVYIVSSNSTQTVRTAEGFQPAVLLPGHAYSLAVSGGRVRATSIG